MSAIATATPLPPRVNDLLAQYPIEFKRWQFMLARVEARKGRDFKWYRNKGITCCIRWLSFINFIEDVGRCPSPAHSLDRIDNTGNYCKENCRWADAKTQARNRSNNTIIEWRGRKHALCVWSEILGFNKNVLANRIQLGWSIERAFTQPAKVRKTKPRPKSDGVELTIVC